MRKVGWAAAGAVTLTAVAAAVAATAAGTTASEGAAPSTVSAPAAVARTVSHGSRTPSTAVREPDFGVAAERDDQQCRPRPGQRHDPALLPGQRDLHPSAHGRSGDDRRLAPGRQLQRPLPGNGRRRLLGRRAGLPARSASRRLRTGATDTGHVGGSGSFALDANGRFAWILMRDNAYLGIHEMTVVGKALTAAYYGSGPRYVVLQRLLHRRSPGALGGPAVSRRLRRHPRRRPGDQLAEAPRRPALGPDHHERGRQLRRAVQARRGHHGGGDGLRHDRRRRRRRDRGSAAVQVRPRRPCRHGYRLR